jgi:hypothetical protein
VPFCACGTNSELYMLGISESLLECHSADKPRILCNIPITLRVHSPCHISLKVQQVLVMKQIVAVSICM